MEIEIHPMTEEDIPSAMEIEEESFEYPWSPNDFFDRIPLKHVVALVAKKKNTEGTVVGFLICSLALLETNNIPEPYSQIDNFAVRESARRQGVGSQLVKELIRIVREKRLAGLFMFVRETNLRAQMFFRAQELLTEGIEEGRYEEIPEDSYLMVRRITAI